MTFSSPGLDRLRRRRILRRIALLVVLVALLILSALLWPGQRPGALRIPTTHASVPPSGVLSGTLRASRAGDRVCFVVDRGRTGAPIVLPTGWAADEQLDLLDPSGLAVAQVGDAVRVTGRPGRTGTAPGCTDRGTVWTVTSLQTA